MRLVISRDAFIIDGVPRGVDLSDLRAFCGVSWDGRRRRFTAPLHDAEMLEADLDRRGVRLADREVRAAVVSAVEHDPLEGPARIAEYGDPRAIPELSRALDAYRQGECAVTDYVIVASLGMAIEALGGDPTEPQRNKIAEYERLQRGAWPELELARARIAEEAPRATLRFSEAEERPVARAVPRLGRNAACHCGSGKEYKLCHLELDGAGSEPRDGGSATVARPTRH
jgi:hypothetical protein